MLSRFYGLDKTDTPPKYFLFPRYLIARRPFQPFFHSRYSQSIMCNIYPCCGYMIRSCTETTARAFMAFSETYNHLSFCLSLQPFQFGITRTQRKSADVPARVSIQPAALSVWICMYIYFVYKREAAYVNIVKFLLERYR